MAIDNAIDPIKIKAEAIAKGDYNKTFKVLEQVFEQRKKCAEIMLTNNSSNAKAYLELCNEQIKKALYL